MADIKLYYFPARGRAEPIRLTLAAAGKKFDDVRLAGEQWAAEKDKSPYGQMPYLVYKGTAYGESKAIASFVAKECGLAGHTNVEALRVDEVYCLVASLLEATTKVRFENDPDNKAKLGKDLQEQTIPKYLGYFNKMLQESGTGYFVGMALTLADLSVQDITFSLLKKNPKLLDDFPEIQKMKANVEGHEAVKAYLESRPDTEM